MRGRARLRILGSARSCHGSSCDGGFGTGKVGSHGCLNLGPSRLVRESGLGHGMLLLLPATLDSACVDTYLLLEDRYSRRVT